MLLADSQSRTKTCSCGGRGCAVTRWALASRLLAIRLWPGPRRSDVLQRRLRVPDLSRCGGCFGRGKELAEKIADHRHAFGERGRCALDADAVGAGEANATVALHERDQRTGIERRLGHE